jgi:molecular chaperone IbpA
MTRYTTYNTTTAAAVLGGPWAIGFDHLRDRLHNIETINNTGNYPPYNIIKHDAENWSIELAVAGFKRSELDIELAEGILTVTAKTESSDDELEYVHRGLAKRAFTRKWTLADDVLVRDAALTDGVLSIKLERIIPEEKKPRKIDIL